jgi:hypothetical protein
MTIRRLTSHLFGSALGCGADSDPLDVSAVLKQLPTPAMPPELTTRIRTRISQERRKRAKVTWAWKLQNEFAHLAVPAAVGLLSAIFIFGICIRIFEVPVRASSDDVPLAVRTPPRLLTNTLIASNGIDSMVVKILIDQNGRVADFHVVRGKQTPEQMRQLETLLIFSLFDPATVFGKPTADTVTLALEGGQLKGYSL